MVISFRTHNRCIDRHTHQSKLHRTVSAHFTDKSLRNPFSPQIRADKQKGNMSIPPHGSDTAKILSFYRAKDDHLSAFDKRHKILHLDKVGKFLDSLLRTGIGVFSDKHIPYQMQTFHNLLTAI